MRSKSMNYSYFFSMEHQANHLITTLAAVFIIFFYIAKIKRKKQRSWAKKLYDIRPRYSITEIFLNNLTSMNAFRVEEFLGLKQEEFKLLHQAIAPKLRKQDGKKREVIDPCDRFALTLRFLVTG